MWLHVLEHMSGRMWVRGPAGLSALHWVLLQLVLLLWWVHVLEQMSGRMWGRQQAALLALHWVLLLLPVLQWALLQWALLKALPWLQALAAT